MGQPAEAFKPHTDGELERREANIIPFPKTYEGYKTLGGTLSQEEYQEVQDRFAKGGFVPSTSLWPGHAKSMAEAAEIDILPEAIDIYAILREEKPYPDKEHYSEWSDQTLLAEALRIVGDKKSLKTFIEFIHKPPRTS